MGEYFDISPPLSERTAVFPGDLPLRREIGLSFARGDHLELSSLAATVHLGCHADAPSHYHPAGGDIASRDLSLYFGPCQVIEVRLPPGERVTLATLNGLDIKAPRVLFCTNSFPDPDRWVGDFNSLSGELVETLADQGVRLLGIDTPSIDPASDKALSAHQAVARRDLAILEGLVLRGVPPGLYTLVALPLKLEGFDASPVRAILLKELLGELLSNSESPARG